MNINNYIYIIFNFTSEVGDSDLDVTVTSVGDECRWQWRFAILIGDRSFSHKTFRN